MKQLHWKLHRLLALGPRIRLSLRRRGLKSFMRRATVKIAGRLGWDIADSYLDWVEDHTLSASSLAAQRLWARTAPDLPRFTLVLRTDGKMRTNLSRTLRALRRQTYCHWSTVVLKTEADASPVTLTQIGSDCDFVGILRAGDTLSPEALYEFARAIVDGDPRPDVLYCDEDHLARDGRTRCKPVFKPSWSPETLLGYHYTGRLTLARRTLVEEVGGLDLSLGDAAEWDLMLRLSERTDRIVRIPLCLYHNGSETCSSDDVHRRTVLESHLKRIGISEAQAVEQLNSTFRVTWPLKHLPLVSVIIPTVDSPDLIRRCIDDLLGKTDYPNKEIILVDNGSTDPRTLALYEQWKTSRAVSIIPFNRSFNYSVACNLGARAARGDFLLFLNNDIEVINRDWLRELVRWGNHPGVGVIGTKLIYPSGAIQHAGVGLQNLGTLMFFRCSDDVQTAPTEAVFGTPNHYRNVSALIGACQLLKRGLFAEIGGYDERSLSACSDVILCARASKLGYRNFYTPYAALIHHESSTRGRSSPSDDLLLLAHSLRDFGFQEDPFFHPELDPVQTTPALPPHWAKVTSSHLRRRIEEMTAFEPGRELTTLGSEWSARAALRNLPDHSSSARVLAEDVGRDIESATWFVIDLLRRDEGLARRFPLALSEGAEGDFCNWLCSEGIVRHGLPQGAAQTIRAAFASQPGYQVSRLIDYQGLENPLFRIARMPNLLEGLGTWLFQHGSKHGISNQQVWWFLVESAEDPIRELIRVYVTNPAWQKHFPDAMSPPGWKRLTHWLRERYSLDATGCDHQSHSPLRPIEEFQAAYRSRLTQEDSSPRDVKGDSGIFMLLEASEGEVGIETEEIAPWLDRVRRDLNADSIERTGLNILGHFCTPSGVQASAISIVKSLQLVGIHSYCRDVLAEPHLSSLNRSKYLGLEVFDTTLIHVQPDYCESCYARAGLNPRPDVHRVGMWYWEFGQAPLEWRRIARSLDEVWAPSRFVAHALRQTLEVPVMDLPPGVEVGEVIPFDRALLGVPESHTLFLFVFDANSVTERKNPLGLITAFRRAFRSDGKATLVIKAGNLRRCAEEDSRIRAAARQAGAIILDQTLPRGELNGLIQACDSYVSLHRSEGFGLTMAEAMLLGKPVIGTAYSANLEFMDQGNSLLIGYELVPVGRQIGPYSKDLLWAEPSVFEAAEAMRWIHENADEARALGERARISAEETLSLQAAGKRFARRLEEIKMSKAVRLDSHTGDGAISKSPSMKGQH